MDWMDWIHTTVHTHLTPPVMASIVWVVAVVGAAKVLGDYFHVWGKLTGLWKHPR
jgi:hypothetical protein